MECSRSPPGAGFLDQAFGRIYLSIHVIGPKIHGILQMLQRNIFDIFTHGDASHCQLTLVFRHFSVVRDSRNLIFLIHGGVFLFETWNLAQILGTTFSALYTMGFCAAVHHEWDTLAFHGPIQIPWILEVVWGIFSICPPWIGMDLYHMYRSGKSKCCHLSLFPHHLTTRLHYWNNIFYGIKSIKLFKAEILLCCFARKFILFIVMVIYTSL